MITVTRGWTQILHRHIQPPPQCIRCGNYILRSTIVEPRLWWWLGRGCHRRSQVQIQYRFHLAHGGTGPQPLGCDRHPCTPTCRAIRARGGTRGCERGKQRWYLGGGGGGCCWACPWFQCYMRIFVCRIFFGWRCKGLDLPAGESPTRRPRRFVLCQ